MKSKESVNSQLYGRGHEIRKAPQAERSHVGNVVSVAVRLTDPAFVFFRFLPAMTLSRLKSRGSGAFGVSLAQKTPPHVTTLSPKVLVPTRSKIDRELLLFGTPNNLTTELEGFSLRPICG